MSELARQDLLQLMQDLERSGLDQKYRIRLFAVVDDPTRVTWRHSAGIVVGTGDGGQPLDLWHALFRYTTRRPGDPVMTLPTRERLLVAIHRAVNDAS